MEEGGKSLYELLGVEKSASQADIKRAYYKLALQLHPDKNPGNEEATAKFTALQRIYAVLGDTDKRALYDETGSLQDCEELAGGGGEGRGGAFGELYKYYSSMFRAVEEDDIIDFALKYRGSGEERADLLRHYGEAGGDMRAVFESVMLSRPELDSHRFMDLIDAAIDAGEAQRTKAYTKWAKATAAKPPPTADPFAPEERGGGGEGGGGGKAKGKGKGKGKAKGGDEAALVKAIRGKSNGMAATLAALEAKYGGGGGKGGSKENAVARGSGGKRRRAGKGGGGGEEGGEGGAGGEPSEAEFEAARRRMEERRAGGGGEQAAAAGAKQKRRKA
ncbi:MAG: hypothetical protein J3K34DRAFT_461492 [Monoraphidium minutum]|nr:MAG: hypothetical protein J3K34DRAFT_461492 [Monoraphidium minutum]